MINNMNLCNDELLLDLIHDRLSGKQVEAMLNHIENCTACRGRMEDLAAGARQWQRTVDVLTCGGDDDAAVCENFYQYSKQLLSQQGVSPITWSETMAKALLSPPSHPEMLGRLGRYEVERLIGSGGMGVVFKGFDTDLNRPVAIKVLAPYLAGSGSARQRFAREARAAAAVVHDHVVPIYNVETERETPFLVMKYIAGDSLQVRIDKEGPLEVTEILRIGTQVAAGLAAAHEQGLVHRDIKPLNILLEQGLERALITDFGLARAADDASLTHTGFQAGTPQYMSPEQVSGSTVDCRSDLFSLGSVIYTMCTGRPPFRAENSFGVMKRIAEESPRSIREINPRIPEWLECIVNKLLAKSPQFRLGTAEEASDLLTQCLAHLQDPAGSALPRTVETWVKEQRKEERRADREFAGSSNSPIQKIRAMPRMYSVAIGLLSIGIVIAAISKYRSAFDQQPDAKKDTLVAASGPEEPKSPELESNMGASPTSPPPQELDWETGFTAIRSLQQELDQFETKLKKSMLQSDSDGQQ